MSTVRKSQELPEDVRDHSQPVPSELKDAAALLLRVGDYSFHVHSFVLASQSVVLREAILGCDLRKAEDGKKSLALLGDDVHVVGDALKYINRRIFTPQPVHLASPLEAVRVAIFADKYDCTTLTREADTYLAAEAARSSVPTSGLLIAPNPSRTAKTGDLLHLTAWDVLDYTAIAQDTGLLRLLCHCIHWLMRNVDVVESARERVAGLAPATLASLTRALAVGLNWCNQKHPQGAAAALQAVPLQTLLTWHGLA